MYERFAEVARSIQGAQLFSEVVAVAPAEPVIELDWNAVSTTDLGFEIEVVNEEPS